MINFEDNYVHLRQSDDDLSAAIEITDIEGLWQNWREYHVKYDLAEKAYMEVREPAYKLQQAIVALEQFDHESLDLFYIRKLMEDIEPIYGQALNRYHIILRRWWDFKDQIDHYYKTHGEK